jgi:nucleotide-binding universal stress UspA family protein
MTTLREIESAYKNAKAAGRLEDAAALSKLYNKQRLKAARKVYPELPSESDDEAGFFENVGTGLASGVVGLYSTAALGATTILEEESELKARDKILKAQAALTPEGGDKDSITYQLSQGVGSILGLVPAAFTGPAALPVAGVISGAAGAGEASERARAEGATEEERSSAAFKGVGVGLTELIPLGRISRRLRIPGLSGAIDKLTGSVDSKTLNGIVNKLKRAAGTGVTEGAQEASAAILQNLIEQGYNPEQVLIESGVLDQGMIGAGSGSIVQLLSDVLIRKGRFDRVEDSGLSSEELAAQAEFEERQESAREERDDIQPDMFAEELNVAEQAEREKQGPPKPETKDEPETETTRDTSTRDMIDELETADLEKMVGRSEQAARLRATRKLDSDRRKRQKEKTVVGRRRILYEVIDSTPSTDATVLTEKFEAALKEKGYRDAKASRGELRSIQTYDFKRGKDASQQVPKAAKQKQFEQRQEQARKERDTAQMDFFPAELREQLDKLNVLPSDSDLSTLEKDVKEKQPKGAQDVRKQTTRTPDTRAARDRVQGSAAVVGQQRTDGTKVAGRPVEGRLDDSVSDTGRPARGTGRPTTALEQQQQLPLGKPTLRSVPKKPVTLDKPIPEDQIDTPVLVNRAEGQPKVIKYKASQTLVPEHKKLGRDRELLKNMVALDTKKRVKDEATERRIPSGTKEVAIYLQKFDTPLDGIINAVYDLADPNRTTLKDADIKTRGLNVKKSAGVIKWASDNLSQETNAAIRKKIKVVREGAAKKASEAKQPTKAQQAVANRKAKKAEPKTTTTKPKAKPAAKKAEPAAKKAEPKAKPAAKKAEPAAKKAEPKTTTTKPKAKPAAKKAEPAAKKPASEVGAQRRVKIDTKAVSQRRFKKVETEVKAAVMQQIADKWKDTGVGFSTLRKMFEARGSTYMLKQATREDILLNAEIDYGHVVREYKLNPEDAKLVLRVASKETMKLLKEGKLREALLNVAKEAESSGLKTTARTFANLLANTKVVFRTPKETMDAYPLEYSKESEVGPAYYDYKTDTIYLHAEYPTTHNILLHETAHALTEVAIERSPRAPAVRELTNLYESIKDRLGTSYGRKDIHEFIAEAFSNRAFRKRLGRIKLEDNKQYTALDKFKNAVMNIIRMLRGDATQQLGSVLNQVDQLGLAILEPNLDPNFRYVSSNDKSVREMAASITERITEARAGKEKKGLRSKFVEFWSDSKADAPGLSRLAKAIHIATLGDIARSNGFEDLGHKLHEMIDKQRGSIDENKALVDKAIERQNKFAKDVGEKAFGVFNRIIFNSDYGATIYDVDPFADSSKYKGKFIESVSLEEVHRQQKEQLRTLTTTERGKLKEQYYYERAFYRKLFDDIAAAMEVEANAMIARGDKEAGRKLLKDLNRQLLSKNKMENYWPLVREGEFRVFFEYINRDPKTGEQIGVENALLSFEHASERDAMVEVLKGEADVNKNSISSFNGDLQRAAFEKAPSGSFISDILDVLQKGGVDQKIQDSVIRMYASTTPESSYIRSLVRRKGDYGYVQNASVALTNKGRSLAVQSAKIKGSSKIRVVTKAIEDKRDELNRRRPDPKATAIANVLVNEHGRFALMGARDKGIERLYKEFNQVAFLYTLGFNVSSAVVNLSQIPLFIVPYLAPRFGLDTTIDEFMRVGRLVGGSGISILDYYNIEGRGEGSTYTLKKSAIDKIRKHAVDKADADVRIQELEAIIPLVKEANLRGKLFTTTMTRELGLEEKATFTDKVSQFSAYFFVQAERFNTQTTLVATYNLIRRNMAERRNAGKKYFSVRQGKEIEVPENINALRKIAVDDALYTTQETNGGATLETTMPYAKEGWGRVALMYKSFGVMMNSSMIKSALIGTKQLFANNPEQQKQALKQLAGIHLSAALFAGVGGIPIWGIVSMLWDLFLDDDEDDADTILRKFITEDYYKGPISSITGMDVSQRIKLNDLIFQENRFMRDPSVEETIGYYLGGPFISTVKRFDRAIDDMLDGEFQRMTESMLPAGASNFMTGLRYYTDDGVTSRRNDFIYEDISGGEVFSKMLGFAPTNYTFNVEKSARDTKVVRAIAEKKQKLSERYYQALRAKDYETADEVWKDIVKFNKDNPDTPLTRESVIKSLKGQMRTTATMHNGVAVSPTYRLALEKSWKEYSR